MIDFFKVEPSDNIQKAYVADSEDPTTPMRVMTPEDIKLREDLNAANTSSGLRAKALAAQAQTNGHRASDFGIDGM